MHDILIWKCSIENEGYVHSNIKLIIFTLIITVFLLVVLFVIFHIDDSANNSSALVVEKERIIPETDEDKALSIEAITYIKNEITLNVSDVFEYEKVIFTFNEGDGSINLSFIVTPDSFGRAITEVIDAKGKAGFNEEKTEENQRAVYESITNGIEEAFENVQNNFNYGVFFEFKTPNMTKTQFMYVSEEGVCSGLFQIELMFNID